MWQGTNYRKWLLTNRMFFENKFAKSVGKLKDLWKALWFLGLPSKTSSYEIIQNKEYS